MRRLKNDKSGTYLYGIVSACERLSGASGVIEGVAGIDGSTVHGISKAALMAVVSDVSNAGFRPTRRCLAAHHGILKHLMGKCVAVLPASCGNISDGPEPILRMLSTKQAELVDQLQRVSNKVEMGLRMRWDVPNIFGYFATIHPELKSMSDEIYNGQEPSRGEKIELGRLFDHLLKGDRLAHTKTVVKVLSGRCFEVRENKVGDEREVMNLACLVGRDRHEDFEKALFEAANLFDASFSFDFNGPWPPYNFVQTDARL